MDEIHTWDLAVSQHNQPCTIGPIILELKNPLTSNQSLIIWDFFLFDMSPHDVLHHGGKFLPDCPLPIFPLRECRMVPRFHKYCFQLSSSLTAVIKQ